MKVKSLLIGCVSGATLVSAANASSFTQETVIEVNDFFATELEDAGVSVTPEGVAVGSNPFFFEISDSTFDTTNGTGAISHNGGLIFANDDFMVTANNFLIDVGADGLGSITGDLSFEGDFDGDGDDGDDDDDMDADDIDDILGATLFTFDVSDIGGDLDAILAALTDIDNPTLPLFISETFQEDILDGLFNIQVAIDDGFGFAATTGGVPGAEIPLPAAVYLMGAGIAGLGFASRETKRRTA